MASEAVNENKHSQYEYEYDDPEERILVVTFSQFESQVKSRILFNLITPGHGLRNESLASKTKAPHEY